MNINIHHLDIETALFINKRYVVKYKIKLMELIDLFSTKTVPEPALHNFSIFANVTS